MKKRPTKFSTGTLESPSNLSRRDFMRFAAGAVARVGTISLLGCQTPRRKPLKNIQHKIELCVSSGNAYRSPPIEKVSQPESDIERLSKAFFYESYFHASNHPIPEFLSQKVDNDGAKVVYISLSKLKELHEEYCEKETYKPQDIATPKSIEVVTITHKGKSLTIPIIRMSGKMAFVNDKCEEDYARGLFLNHAGIILVKQSAKQTTLDHESMHAQLYFEWKKSDISEYAVEQIRAEKILTPSELQIINSESDDFLSMDNANEMVADAIEKIKSDNDPDGYCRVRFALGINIMKRITSFLVYGNKPVTKNTYEKIDPYNLLKRLDQWTDQEWAKEAAEHASKKSPLAVLLFAQKIIHAPWGLKLVKQAAKDHFFIVIKEAPFLIEVLGPQFFEEELSDNPRKFILIPKYLREKYWPDKSAAL